MERGSCAGTANAFGCNGFRATPVQLVTIPDLRIFVRSGILPLRLADRAGRAQTLCLRCERS